MRFDTKAQVMRVDVAQGRYICIVPIVKKDKIVFYGIVDDESKLATKNDGDCYYQNDFERITKRAMDKFMLNSKHYGKDIINAFEEEGLIAEKIEFNESVCLINYDNL